MNTLTTYRTNPWTVFNNDLFKLFDDFEVPLVNPVRVTQKEFPKCEIEETDKFFVMNFDLPGVNKEDLNIEVNDGVLTLKGERKKEVKKGTYSERFYGAFERSFTLSDGVNADKIEAHFENGVLQVTLPKAEIKAGRKIEIGNGEPGKKEESAA